MNASIKNLASLLSTLTLGLGLSLGATGCLIDGGPTTVVSDPGVADVTIDTGASLDSTPGDGVGFFVEYQGNGRWNAFTTCDTSISGASCNFDVVISADSDVVISGVEGRDLNDGDTLTLDADGTINLVTDTDFGQNGLTFSADPGATIEFDVLLDGAPQPAFVFAVSDGAVMQGAPSNPVDFTPALP
jgi:hypothetical protein